jgi:transcriptional regulator with XRE-family HTH domain
MKINETMYTIGETLKSERLRLGMNQDDFAAAGGVKKRTQISYEQDERCPDGLYFRALAAIGVDVQYILTGRRSSIALTTEENELLTGYRQLDIRGKANMLGMLDVVGTAPPEKPKKKAPQETYGIKYAAPVKQVIEGSQTVHGDLNFQANDKKKKKKSLEG